MIKKFTLKNTYPRGNCTNADPSNRKTIFLSTIYTTYYCGPNSHAQDKDIVDIVGQQKDKKNVHGLIMEKNLQPWKRCSFRKKKLDD